MKTKAEGGPVDIPFLAALMAAQCSRDASLSLNAQSSERGDIDNYPIVIGRCFRMDLVDPRREMKRGCKVLIAYRSTQCEQIFDRRP